MLAIYARDRPPLAKRSAVLLEKAYTSMVHWNPNNHKRASRWVKETVEKVDSYEMPVNLMSKIFNGAILSITIEQSQIKSTIISQRR